MPEQVHLHPHELMEERRAGDRRAIGRMPRDGDRRQHERRGHDTVASAPQVRRIFPLGEATDIPRSRRRLAQRVALVASDLLAAAIAIAAAATAADVTLPASEIAAGAALTALVAQLASMYDRDELVLRRSTLDETPQIAQIAGVVALAFWLLLEPGLDRGGFLTLWGLLVVTLAGGRATARYTCRVALPPERCLFIGDGAVVDNVKAKVESGRANAVVVAALELRPGQTADDLDGVDGLRRLASEEHVDRVIIAPVTTDAADTLELVRVAKLACTQVTIFPRLFEVIGTAVEFEDLEGMTLIGVRRFGLAPGARALKRAFDLVAGTVLAVALVPVLLLIALAIRLDSPGPVLFRQLRVGRDGRRFCIYKFRTMCADAEDRKAALRPYNETTGLFKIADDPRITRVGRLLRRTAFDELPQVWNVLRGEMSLVGPRPLVVDEDQQVLGLDRARLHLTPGMTGPWQILRSGRVPMHEMVGIDYLYVANWSLWNDLKLLLRTVVYVLGRRGM